MGCPYCGASLNGYVELGSKGYQRVKAGCCPSCGRGMPAGMSVGFKKSTADLDPRVSESAVADSYAKTAKYSLLSIYFALLGGMGIFMWGNVWWAGLLGLIYGLLFGFFGWAHYGVNMMIFIQGSYRKSHMRTSAYFIFVLVVSLILLAVGVASDISREGFSLLRLLGGVAGLLFLDHIFSILLYNIFEAVW